MKYLKPTAFNIAEAQEIAKQAEVELAILLGLEQSLRIVLQWMTRDRGNSHKLSTLRFAARSFERQLSRTRALADYGGYLHLATDFAPQLANDVHSLSNRRDELQVGFEKIVLRLEYVSPDDAAGFAKVCEELENYLADVRAHSEKELALLQCAFKPKEV